VLAAGLALTLALQPAGPAEAKSIFTPVPLAQKVAEKQALEQQQLERLQFAFEQQQKAAAKQAPSATVAQAAGKTE
jgi:hypothetical protein